MQVMDTTKKEAKSRYIKKESDPTRAEVEWKNGQKMVPYKEIWEIMRDTGIDDGDSVCAVLAKNVNTTNLDIESFVLGSFSAN